MILNKISKDVKKIAEESSENKKNLINPYATIGKNHVSHDKKIDSQLPCNQHKESNLNTSKHINDSNFIILLKV